VIWVVNTVEHHDCSTKHENHNEVTLSLHGYNGQMLSHEQVQMQTKQLQNAVPHLWGIGAENRFPQCHRESLLTVNFADPVAHITVNINSSI